jgi:transposase
MEPVQKRWEEFQMMIATSTVDESRLALIVDVKAVEFEEKRPPVIDGADALLRTSLASMLWYWPLRQRSQHRSRHSRFDKRRSRRWR